MKCPECEHEFFPKFVSFKEYTKQEIISQLFNQGKLRWSELKKQLTVCQRTLSTRLHELQKEGIITRTVDISTSEYPPPVFYEISQEYMAKLEVIK